MSTAPVGKIILFASLGLAGLVLIGIGSWMLLSPLTARGVEIIPSAVAGISPAPPSLVASPTFAFATTTPLVVPPEATATLEGTLAAETPTPNRTPSVSPTAWAACPNSYYSHLQVGMKGKLSEEPPLPNRVREAANTSAKIVGMIQPGEIVDIIDGPACYNNWVWWKVRKADGVIGWTAEGDASDYWLLPVKP